MSPPKTFSESLPSHSKGNQTSKQQIDNRITQQDASSTEKRKAALPCIVINARGGMIFRIRAFERKDIDSLYFLMHRCCPPKLMPSFEQLLHLLLQPNSAVLVAQLIQGDSFGLAGGVLVCWDKSGSVMELCWCGTHEHFRRRGLGRGMMKVVKDLAIRQGLQELVKGIEKENQTGQDFLTALGFHDSNHEHPVLWGKIKGHAWRLKLSASASSTAQIHDKKKSKG